MSNGMSNTDESNALLGSVGVGQWNWDGGQKRLVLDVACKQFFDLAWDDAVSMQVLQDNKAWVILPSTKEPTTLVKILFKTHT